MRCRFPVRDAVDEVSFWGLCDLRARGQGSEVAVPHVGEREGGAHGGAEPRVGLGAARGLAWVDRLRGGFWRGRCLVSF